VGPQRAARLARLGGAAVIVVGGAWLYGHARLARWSQLESAPSVRIAVIQPSLPEEWRHSLAHVRDAVDRLRALTDQTRTAAPQLVVWPENAISISPDAIRMLARESGVVPSGAALLVGAPRAVQHAPGRALLHNAAYLVDDAWQSRAVYDKRVLTPWAETAPWPLSLRPGLWPSAPGDYTPGTPSADLPRVDGHPFGVTICSEAVHATLIRTQVLDGATFLVNLANDAWFGDEPAAAQHAAAALLRAVESRRALVRGTTSGISLVVQPSGRVVARAPVGAATALVVDVPVVDVATPYTRTGEAFAWACAALVVAVLAVPGRR
jgi:apolipoprotein N-acyltransferase